jgi:hypothetical protein
VEICNWNEGLHVWKELGGRDQKIVIVLVLVVVLVLETACFLRAFRNTEEFILREPALVYDIGTACVPYRGRGRLRTPGTPPPSS